MVVNDHIPALRANKCVPTNFLTSELIGRNVREQLEARRRSVNLWGDNVGPTRHPTWLIHLKAGGHKMISSQRHLSDYVPTHLGLSFGAQPNFRRPPRGPFRGDSPLPPRWRSLTPWSPPTISNRKDKSS
jgi:hypothetical protein